MSFSNDPFENDTGFEKLYKNNISKNNLSKLLLAIEE